MGQNRQSSQLGGLCKLQRYNLSVFSLSLSIVSFVVGFGLRLSVVCLRPSPSIWMEHSLYIYIYICNRINNVFLASNHAPCVGHLFSGFGSGDDNVRWDGPTRATWFLICPPHRV